MVGSVFLCVKSTTNFNKTAFCSHDCLLLHEHRHWGIGMLGYTFRSAIQARAIPPPSWGSAPSLATNSSIMVHRFAIYIHLVRKR